MDENNTQPNNQGINPKTLRTYTSDMADAIRENEMSVIKIAVAEQKKRAEEEMFKKARGSGVSRFFLFIGSIALIGGGIAGTYFLLQKKEEAIAPIEVKKDIETFISYNEKVFVDMTNATNASDVTNLLKDELDKREPPRSIKALFLTTSASGKPELLSTQKLVSLLKLSAPGPLSRSLEGQYLVGTYTYADTERTPSLFLMFKTNDYNVAYAGMLKWESTMLNDFFGLFRVDIREERGELFERPWKDIIINNRDARILYDQNGDEVLYYIFLDKDKIIITDSQETIKEIMTRLSTKNIQP